MKAPARSVYHVISDVTRWPLLFGPSVYVRHLERSEAAERFQLWALTNGEVKSWVSSRDLDSRELRIGFRQERTQHPMDSMGGDWSFEELAAGQTRVVLRHDFTAVGDDPAHVSWINTALDHNSASELGALKAIVEQDHPVDDVLLSFQDTLTVRGSIADAYQFVNEADQWSRRLPHVSRSVLETDEAGVQHLEMDTRSSDGASHTTRSVRVCFPDELIVYKQTTPPALLTAHTGAWSFIDTPAGARVTARHSVAVRPSAISPALGAQATLADAKAFAREVLGANSRATLERVKAHAEGVAAVGDGGTRG